MEGMGASLGVPVTGTTWALTFGGGQVQYYRPISSSILPTQLLAYLNQWVTPGPD